MSFAIAASEHRQAVRLSRRRRDPYAFRHAADQLLTQIEEALFAGRGRKLLPDELWYDLAALADQVDHPTDPPDRYLQGHEYVLDLLAHDQARRRVVHRSEGWDSRGRPA